MRNANMSQSSCELVSCMLEPVRLLCLKSWTRLFFSTRMSFSSIVYELCVNRNQVLKMDPATASLRNPQTTVYPPISQQNDLSAQAELKNL